jgi:hypothetical protein
VQQEREEKARAKAAQKEAKKQNIQRAAEFECADLVNEDIANATPRPAFTPKPWPPPKTVLTPVAEAADVDFGDGGDTEAVDSDEAYTDLTELPASELSAEEGPAIESDPPPPAKKPKIQPTGQVKVNPAHTNARKGKKADQHAQDILIVSNGEVMPDSDEEPPQEPKPKKTKVKLRDQINVAAKKIEQKNDGDTAKSTSSQQEEESIQSSGRPAPKIQSRVKPRPLKREGAIADLNVLYQKAESRNPDLSSKQKDDNNLMR